MPYDELPETITYIDGWACSCGQHYALQYDNSEQAFELGLRHAIVYHHPEYRITRLSSPSPFYQVTI